MPHDRQLLLQARFLELFEFDRKMLKRKRKIIAGVDEAGRGPLAGPVVAAACVLPENIDLVGIDDSKKLTAKQRLTLFDSLTSHPHIFYGLGIVSSQEIDRINIYQATIQAMQEAIEKLSVCPDLILIDGMAISFDTISSEKVIGGDAKSLSIAAASIIAKETRDRLMLDYHASWPHYAFDRHKGYGTPQHLAAISQYGPSPIHRLSFSPFKEQI